MDNSGSYMDDEEYAEYTEDTPRSYNEYESEKEERKIKKPRSKDYDFGQKDVNLLGSMDVKFGLSNFDNVKLPDTNFSFGFGLNKSKRRR